MYNALYHYGVKGMKWGVRRYQNSDGSLTEVGKSHHALAKRGKDGIIKTDEPRTLDFSGVRGFLVTNVCIVQRSAA